MTSSVQVWSLSSRADLNYGCPVPAAPLHSDLQCLRIIWASVSLTCAGETVSAEYELEYGKDKIEMCVGAIKEGQRVLLMDDLIATGGTLAAGIKLIRQVHSPLIYL